MSSKQKLLKENIQLTAAIRQALEASPGPAAFWNKDLYCEFANQAFYQLLELDATQTQTQPYSELLGKEHYLQVKKHIDQALAGNKQNLESALNLRSGNNITLKIHYVPLKDDQTVIGFISSALDITDLKKREVRITERENLAHDIIFSLPNSFSHCDLNEVLLTVNPAYAERWGLSYESIIGKKVIEVLGEEAYKLLGHHVKRVLSGETFAFEYEKPDPEGNPRYFEVRFTPHMVNGKVMGGFSVSSDVTALKQKELMLAQASKLATLGELSASIAHEINNPLTVIIGKAETIDRFLKKDHPNEERLLKNIQSVINTAHRISKIVGGFRMISRTGQNDPLEKVNLQELLNTALTFCEKRITTGGIAFEKPSNLDFNVMGNPIELSQVFINLLNNAFDAVVGKTEPWIKIVATETSGLLQIRVINSGPPIPPALAEKIFQSFYTTKEKGKGTGLGLSISSGIMKRHGGKLYLDSNHENICFVIEIPLLVADQKAA